MHRIKLITSILLCLLSEVCCYTTYSEQQMRQISQKQNQQWNHISADFQASQSLAFILQSRLIFYFKSHSYPQTLKMRAHAYFVDDRRKFVDIQELSPFDVTKIYIYSEKGLIIKSQEFYEILAIEFTVKQNQQYQIMFVDGPPGPPKLIQLQIDTQFQTILQPLPPINLSDMKLLSARINSVSEFVQQSMHYSWISNMQATMLNSQFQQNSKLYEVYIIIEALFTVLVAFGQVYMIKKMSQKNLIVII